jgi:hypothetical protein
MAKGIGIAQTPGPGGLKIFVENFSVARSGLDFPEAMP